MEKEIKDINKQMTEKLTQNELLKFMDLYFDMDGKIYEHLHNSFNKLMDEDIKIFLEKAEHIFEEHTTMEGKFVRYKFLFSDISIRPPTTADDELMTPTMAKDRNLTYGSTIIAKVSQIQEIYDMNTDEKIIKIVGRPEENIPIASIPIMIKSKYCTLSMNKDIDDLECTYDFGGYFIVNGMEKVIIPQDRMCENKPLVFIKKESGVQIYNVQVNSKSYITSNIIQVIRIQMKKDNVININVPLFSEIPVFVLFKALGIDTDREIIRYVAYDETDIGIVNIIRMALETSVNEKGVRIQTQQEAINFLTTKLKVVKKFPETNVETRQKQKEMYLKYLLLNNFLPHVDGGLFHKAVYLGYMLNKLIKCYIGRTQIDDRDSYINKRIDLPGSLIEELFKQHFRTMLNDCGKFFKKKNVSDDEPFNIINKISPNQIEQGLKTALSTGAWGKKKGVAQVLQQMSYLWKISYLRRVDAQVGDASNSKLPTPRQLHPSSAGMLCPTETPEHGKVGLNKHLSLIGSITVIGNSQYIVIKEWLKTKIINIREIESDKLKEYIKVFLNGEMVGSIKTSKLYDELCEKKVNGDFDNKIAIIYDIYEKEIKIYSDTGRLYRPVVNVVENELQLTRKQIESVSLDKLKKTNKITNWNEFMLKYPEAISYIDMEEMPYLLIAEDVNDVYEMRDRMLKSKNEVPKKGIVENRYDEMSYIKYTHCEFHPQLLVGVITTNVPFCNCQPGTRNIFQYSQGKQGMGIYATNYRYRFRTDFNFILYHPARSLISTYTSKYIFTDILPPGENAIIAIACYTGYNQEDSIVINKSAIDRGLFRSKSLRTYISVIQKNQSTSQDDIFMKPEPTKVTGMKLGSYDKLNDKGYIPEEVEVENGDILIGKVTPIQPTERSMKIYKDNSEVYKSIISGVVDKVLKDVYNNEGYEMRKIRVRSERIPTIGDKHCTRYGQKFTIGLVSKQSDMPYTEKGITPDIIMNPNCIPSRMTASQLIECVYGKISAIEGHETDATSFNRIDEKKLMDDLEKLGYKGNGTEIMYNGMTGTKMKSEIYIGAGFVQRLKHLVHDKIHCLTMDHEILTFAGWKTFEEITKDDKIATLNEDQELEYKQPEKLLYYPNFDGMIYTIKNNSIDLTTTMNHRMYIAYEENDNKFNNVSVDKIIGKNVRYKRNGCLANSFDYELMNENMLKLIGCIITDVSSYDLPKCLTIQNEKNKNKILEIINKLEIQITELNKDRYILDNKEIFEYANGKNLNYEKYMPEWIWELSKTQCMNLIEGILINNILDDMNIYTTKSKKFANDFMRLCIHIGWVCDIDKINEEIYKLTIWKTNDKMMPYVIRYKNETINYTKQPVFCLEVPNEIFMVRRNGRHVWTGNSRARGTRTFLTRQPPEGRSRNGGLRVGEMERDCLIAHGISGFLKEKLMDSSDIYATYVCDICGLFAQRMRKITNKQYVSVGDTYYCPACRNKTKISKIIIPYAFKLLLQELMSMCIAPRIKTKSIE